MRKLPYLVALFLLIIIPLILLVIFVKSTDTNRTPSSETSKIIDLDQLPDDFVIVTKDDLKEFKDAVIEEEVKKPKGLKMAEKKEEKKEEQKEESKDLKKEEKKEPDLKDKKELKLVENKKEEKKEEPKVRPAPLKRKDYAAINRAYQQEVELNDQLVSVMFQQMFSMIEMMMQQQMEFQTAMLAQRWAQPLPQNGWNEELFGNQPMTLNRNYHLYQAPQVRNWDQYYYQGPSIFNDSAEQFGEMGYYSPDLVDPRIDQRAREDRKNIFHEFPAPAADPNPSEPSKPSERSRISVLEIA